MAPSFHPSLLLFTDLDGTLIDHYNYSWEPAREALSAAAAHRVPVIFNTSKTFAECRDLQRKLQLDQPFIFENGGGVALPEQSWPAPRGSQTRQGFHLHLLSTPYRRVREIVIGLRERGGYRCRGFGDLTTAEIEQYTGLTRDAVALARERYCTEPLIWEDSDARLAEFTQRSREAGLNVTRGGRFVHVMGAADKGRALHWLAEQYGQPRPKVVALGDSENDLPMLRRADIAVLVRSPAHELPMLPLEQRPPGYLVTEDCGPAGWNRAVKEIIKELAHG